MIEPTIDQILAYFYNAIDSSKLDEDNIIINENLVIEDSKNKYLQAFAKFLNDSYHKGYRISESIISKLMNIIDYEGYEWQIIQQYIKILNTAIIEDGDVLPNCANLSPEKCIEYINLYLQSKDNNYIPYYLYTEDIYNAPEAKKRTLIEVSDPIPMIINDMKKWIDEHSEE